ncbi:MAG: hypothetical protein HC825_03575 [Oscillatoriales cyanobacterium RM1_1_9]|nr:hypothetical protein [Oscillatoriales cyanobacterium RM1_1_9]
MGCTILITLASLAQGQPAQQSQYSINSQVPFNQPDYYPIQQTVSSNLYYPTKEWLGRLILPTIAEYQQDTSTSDWCWIELYQTPATDQDLLGKRVKLTWQQTPELQNYVKKVTVDVQFTAAAQRSQQAGNVLPERLNGRSRVGPLQSLAGARPKDDLIVGLDSVKIVPGATPPVLQINRDPLQVTGRYVGLLEILKSTGEADPFVPVCPAGSPCPGSFFLARHYNPQSGQFDGPQGTIYIPQQPPSPRGVFPSTSSYIENSPEGRAGWYLYGAQNQNGVFTVEAIKPRQPFRLQPQTVILGRRQGLDYIKNQNWQDTETRKGTAQSVLVDPVAETIEAAIAQWKVGDYALVVHLFGGIGGEKAEPAPFGTVTGHFAYGIAQVIQDPFTNELKFNTLYEQVYAHNPNGIVAGSHTWSDFMGNLQRGWLGTRPVSDLLVKFEALTQNYDFDGLIFSPMEELLKELQVMTAAIALGRERRSLVTPATSCVQDSNQALYITIEQIKQKFYSTPAIQQWLETHPDDPQTLRFQELVALGQDLRNKLAPRGGTLRLAGKC